MIPNFGDILTQQLIGCDTFDKTKVKFSAALAQFWQELINLNKLAAFNFTGVAIVGPTSINVNGLVGGINAMTMLHIPSADEVGKELSTKPNPYTGFFHLFAITIEQSIWQIDCSAASYSTPCIAKLSCKHWRDYADEFIDTMYNSAATTQQAAMTIISSGVKEFLQLCVNEVSYTGTGAGQLTGTMTVQFSS